MTTYTPTAHEPGCDCTQCSAGQRNRFFKGKLMKAPEFAMEQAYGIERRRLLTRSLAGWGVVRGLAIRGAKADAAEEFCVTPGLAIDCQGREILLCGDTVLDDRNTFVIAANCELKSVERLEPGPYVLAIHYAELRFGDAALPGECCGTETEKNYVCETVLFSLRPLCEDCHCGEPECPKGCECRSGRCSGEHGRGSHLCCWTAGAEGSCPPSKPCCWRDHDVYVGDGIDLACLRVRERGERCHPPKGYIEDDCGPRRFVKSNDLLYNLIRGCDLTRIASVSWGEWHRREKPVPWEDFVKRLSGKRENGVLVTGLTVHFTGPVLADTVKPDCFTMQFLVGRGEMRTRSVEITHVLTPIHDGDPVGTTRVAILCVRPEWYEDFTAHSSRVRKEGAHVRIEVNGYFILDCHHQPIDAGARGFALQKRDHLVKPGGTGSPGGLLISAFKVARDHNCRPDYSDEENARNDQEEYRYEQSR